MGLLEGAVKRVRLFVFSLLCLRKGGGVMVVRRGKRVVLCRPSRRLGLRIHLRNRAM